MSNKVIDRPPIIIPESTNRPKLQKPPLYMVFMSSTQMGFRWYEGQLYAPKVCFQILTDIFDKRDMQDHVHLWEVYNKGISLVFKGVMEAAETKSEKANNTLQARLGENERTKHFNFTFESEY